MGNEASDAKSGRKSPHHLSSVLQLLRLDPRKCWPHFCSPTLFNCPGGKWIETKIKVVLYLVCLWVVLMGT